MTRFAQNLCAFSFRSDVIVEAVPIRRRPFLFCSPLLCRHTNRAIMRVALFACLSVSMEKTLGVNYVEARFDDHRVWNPDG